MKAIAVGEKTDWVRTRVRSTKRQLLTLEVLMQGEEKGVALILVVVRLTRYQKGIGPDEKEKGSPWSCSV